MPVLPSLAGVGVRRRPGVYRAVSWILTASLAARARVSALAWAFLALAGAGTVHAAAEIDVTPSSIDFGVVSPGSSPSLNITITNTGDANLDVTGVAFDGASSSRFSLGGATAPPTLTIAPLATEVVTVTFSPNNTTQKTATVEILSSDVNVNVPVIGNAADITVTPLAIDFGSVPLGSPATQQVMIANDGSASLTVSSISATGSATFSTPSFTSTAITAGNSITVDVTFDPTLAQAETGNLLIASDDPDEASESVLLDGVGAAVATPEVDVSPLTLDFGLVAASSSDTLQFTISNPNSGGEPDLEVTDIAFCCSSSSRFSLGTLPPLPLTLAPGASQVIDVDFNPTDGNSKTGTVRVSSDDPDEGTVDIALVGNDVPDITVTPLTVDFGPLGVGGTSTQQVTIMNDGTADLNVTSVSTTGSSTFSTPGFSGLISAGNSVQVDVSFDPATAQAETGMLVVASDDPDETSVSVDLDGEGTAAPTPEIDVTPSALDFGLVAASGSGTLQFTISNPNGGGEPDLEVTDIAFCCSSSARFSLGTLPTLPMILAPGASQVIDVNFNPTDGAPKTGTVRVSSDDPNEGTVDVPVVGNDVPDITVSPLSFDFASVVVGSTSTDQVTIMNDGSEDLNVTSVSTTGSSTFSTPGFSGLILSGNSVQVDVSFDPTTVQAEVGMLVVASDDPDEASVSIDLDGLGVAAGGPDIDSTPFPDLDFGTVSVGGSSALPVTIRNLGTAVLDISSLGIASGSSSTFTTPSQTNVVLLPTTSIVVNVTFQPTAGAAEAGTLEILSNDPDEATFTVNLSGSGDLGAQPEISVLPAALDFGDVSVGNMSTLQVTVENTGAAVLTVSSVARTGSSDFTLGGFAGGSIGVGASETVDVTFDPSSAGAKSATLVFQSDDLDESTVNVDLDGNGTIVIEPEISVTPGALDFGQILLSGSDTLQVTIMNTGNADLDVTAVTLGGSSEFSKTGFSGGIISMGGSAMVDVTFDPTDVGSENGSLTIASTDIDEPSVIVNLTAEGIDAAPEITVLPTAHSFGAVLVGASAIREVTISNVGDASLDITGISLSGSGDFSRSGFAGGAIPAGANEVVEIMFDPADVGTENATLEVTSDDPDEPSIFVSLSGEGVDTAAEIEVTPGSIDFGMVAVGSSVALPISVSNTGDADLMVSEVTKSGSGRITISGFSGGAIAPGASEDVIVTFLPTVATAKAATVRVLSNDLDESVVAIAVSGQGVVGLGPDLDVAPTTLDFGTVTLGSAPTQQVTLTNAGDTDLQVTGLATTGDGTFTLGGFSGGLIAPGNSEMVSVTFAPDAVSTDSGTLEVSSTDPDEALVIVTFEGAGQSPNQPDVDVNPTTLDFGGVLVGVSNSIQVTVANNGSAPLVVSGVASGSGSNSAFSLGGFSGGTIEAGNSEAIDVTFLPTVTGAAAGTLEISSNDSDESTVVVNLSGTGQSTGTPDIDVTPLLLQFGDVPVGTTSVEFFEIANLGNAPLSVSRIEKAIGSSTRFILGGPSSLVLGPLETAQIEVTFAPINGNRKEVFVEIDSDDPDEPLFVIELRGRGLDLTEKEIVVQPTSVDFGGVAVGGSADEDVIIRNIGPTNLVVSGVSLSSGSNGDLSITGGGSGGTVVPGGSLTVQITLAPTSGGAKLGTLEIASDDADENLTSVDISGIGAVANQPDIAVSPLNLNFGKIAVGSNLVLTTTIANNGSAVLNVTDLSFVSGSSTSFGTSIQGLTLEPTASANISVTFSPVLAGMQSGTLAISNNDPDNGTVLISLLGDTTPIDDDGIDDPIDLEPVVFSNDFSDEGLGGTTNGSITSRGNQTLEVTDVVSPDGVRIASSIVGPGLNEPATFALCSGILNVSVDGGDELVVTCGGGSIDVASGPVDTTFNGDSGVVAAAAIDSGNGLSFDPQTMTFIAPNSNTDPVLLLIEDIQFSIAPGDEFTPPASPFAQINPAPIDFGPVPMGTAAVESVEIRNVGTDNLALLSVTLSEESSGFNLVGQVPQITLIPGTSLFVELTFEPVQDGSSEVVFVVTTGGSNSAEIRVPVVGTSGGALFQRADSNVDGRVDISDGIFTLNWQFAGTLAPPCLLSADANRDFGVDISDVIFTLTYQFNGGMPPPAPLSVCGTDGEAESSGLDCGSYPPCSG